MSTSALAPEKGRGRTCGAWGLITNLADVIVDEDDRYDFLGRVVKTSPWSEWVANPSIPLRAAVPLGGEVKLEKGTYAGEWVRVERYLKSRVLVTVLSGEEDGRKTRINNKTLFGSGVGFVWTVHDGLVYEKIDTALNLGCVDPVHEDLRRVLHDERQRERRVCRVAAPAGWESAVVDVIRKLRVGVCRQFGEACAGASWRRYIGSEVVVEKGSYAGELVRIDRQIKEKEKVDVHVLTGPKTGRATAIHIASLPLLD